eukprot:scaffold1896_cov121-Isochrysis_galbana.AAC.16
MGDPSRSHRVQRRVVDGDQQDRNRLEDRSEDNQHLTRRVASAELTLTLSPALAFAFVPFAARYGPCHIAALRATSAAAAWAW